GGGEGRGGGGRGGGVGGQRAPAGRGRRSRRSLSRVTRLATAGVVIGAVCVTGAFASAGALPQPAQHAASAVLGSVGISVPSGNEPPQTGTSTPPGATSPPHAAATATGPQAGPPYPPSPPA